MKLLSLLLPFLPLAFSLSTIYWPVTNPSETNPWVIGNKNLVAWKTGGGTGIESFDIQLHNSNRTIMVGFLPIALRVPMEKLPGKKYYGGEIEVDLVDGLPTGDGFFLIFMNTYHGEVYAKSPKFSIYATKPDNYTDPDLPTATVTATLTTVPNPTQQWAMTLNGIDPDATASGTAIAGNAGSGT
ncbi:uncharacterized protein L199_004128 [Kwoniella botswanensis]|uniref:uncharacterized protein n=1 Tax=Kwoniella botswanensis TaxID=1268659 RepID=UPI00315DB04C